MPSKQVLARLIPNLAHALAHGDSPRLPALRGRAPIVLLHGFGASSRVLAPIARNLSRELGRPVIRLRLGCRLPLHIGDVRSTARAVQLELLRLARREAFPYVDVVGHSLGGLVATYLLKSLDRGRRVRKVVTLGTPHNGTPAALLGALLFGAFSRAIWQMIPGSPLLREIAALPVPDGSELIALDSDADGLVPTRFARPAPAPNLARAELCGLGHIDLLLSPLAFQAVRGALQGPG
jgi:triacylglycerol esterase/lipase EstA (alpha/beta hydrolase family)